MNVNNIQLNYLNYTFIEKKKHFILFLPIYTQYQNIWRIEKEFSEFK